MLQATTTGILKDSYAQGGSIGVYITPVYCSVSRPMTAELTPDEARLLGLRLIRLADQADAQRT